MLYGACQCGPEVSLAVLHRRLESLLADFMLPADSTTVSPYDVPASPAKTPFRVPPASRRGSSLVVQRTPTGKILNLPPA